MVANGGKFQKGHKSLGGRRPIILPEVQKALDQHKNALKIAILEKLDESAVKCLEQIFDSIITHGDAIKFKAIVEMALGKMDTPPPEFEVSEDEKLLILEYRRRLKEQNDSNSNEESSKRISSEEG